MRNQAWHVPQVLDLDAMRTAAAVLVGSHNFAAFTPRSEVERGSTTRVVTRAEWTCAGSEVTFDVEANAFLQRMVRRLVAALVEVGKGRRTAKEFRSLVEEAVPGAAPATVPARGLCLMKVRYESGLFDDETNEDI